MNLKLDLKVGMIIVVPAHDLCITHIKLCFFVIHQILGIGLRIGQSDVFVTTPFNAQKNGIQLITQTEILLLLVG